MGQSVRAAVLQLIISLRNGGGSTVTQWENSFGTESRLANLLRRDYAKAIV